MPGIGGSGLTGFDRCCNLTDMLTATLNIIVTKKRSPGRCSSLRAGAFFVRRPVTYLHRAACGFPRGRLTGQDSRLRTWQCGFETCPLAFFVRRPEPSCPSLHFSEAFYHDGRPAACVFCRDSSIGRTPAAMDNAEDRGSSPCPCTFLVRQHNLKPAVRTGRGRYRGLQPPRATWAKDALQTDARFETWGGDFMQGSSNKKDAVGYRKCWCKASPLLFFTFLLNAGLGVCPMPEATWRNW